MDFLVPAVSALIGGSINAALKGPAETLSQLWHIKIGHRIEIKHEKLKPQIKALEQETAKEISKIPETNIQEPKFNIAGPTLDAAIYHLEEQEIRSMFAKLLASSIDSSKNDISQPAFPEIIKQLTIIDARILSFIYNSINYSDSIIKLHIVKKLNDGSYNVALEHIYLKPQLSAFSEQRISSSVTNLIRLGLVNVDYSASLLDDSMYKYYQEYVDNLSTSDLPEDRQFELMKGVIKLSSLGKDFCKICI